MTYSIVLVRVQPIQINDLTIEEIKVNDKKIEASNNAQVVSDALQDNFKENYARYTFPNYGFIADNLTSLKEEDLQEAKDLIDELSMYRLDQFTEQQKIERGQIALELLAKIGQAAGKKIIDDLYLDGKITKRLF